MCPGRFLVMRVLVVMVIPLCCVPRLFCVVLVWGGGRCSPDLCWAVEGFMCLFFPEFWGFCGLLTDGMVFCGMISYLYQM